MAKMFPSPVCKLLLVGATALLLFAGTDLSHVIFSKVAVSATAAAEGDELQGGEGYAGAMAGVAPGKYARCRRGCPDGLFVCKDWCFQQGYSNGGECAPPPPVPRQCCCFAN
ncbi:hypothetical protein ACP4OV_002243 [Aristida adscensionis]